MCIGGVLPRVQTFELVLYNAVIENLKWNMGREGLNMTSVNDWLPSQSAGLQVSCSIYFPIVNLSLAGLCWMHPRDNVHVIPNLKPRAPSPTNSTVSDLEKDGVVFLIPARHDIYTIIFPFIYLN